MPTSAIVASAIAILALGLIVALIHDLRSEMFERRSARLHAPSLAPTAVDPSAAPMPAPAVASTDTPDPAEVAAPDQAEVLPAADVLPVLKASSILVAEPVPEPWTPPAADLASGPFRAAFAAASERRVVPTSQPRLLPNPFVTPLPAVVAPVFETIDATTLRQLPAPVSAAPTPASVEAALVSALVEDDVDDRIDDMIRITASGPTPASVPAPAVARALAPASRPDHVPGSALASAPALAPVSPRKEAASSASPDADRVDWVLDAPRVARPTPDFPYGGVDQDDREMPTPQPYPDRVERVDDFEDGTVRARRRHRVDRVAAAAEAVRATSATPDTLPARPDRIRRVDRVDRLVAAARLVEQSNPDPGAEAVESAGALRPVPMPAHTGTLQRPGPLQRPWNRRATAAALAGCAVAAWVIAR